MHNARVLAYIGNIHTFVYLCLLILSIEHGGLARRLRHRRKVLGQGRGPAKGCDQATEKQLMPERVAKLGATDTPVTVGIELRKVV